MREIDLSPAQRKDREDADNTRFKSLVAMYETMKPKDRAAFLSGFGLTADSLEPGKKIKPPSVGSKKYPVLGDAPGTYVLGT